MTDFLALAKEYVENNQEAVDRCNPAKAGWKHRIISRQWVTQRKEADDCLIWVIRNYGTAGINPASGKLWAGQFLPMEGEICSRVIFYTDDDTIAAAFSDKWSD